MKNGNLTCYLKIQIMKTLQFIIYFKIQSIVHKEILMLLSLRVTSLHTLKDGLN